MISITYLVLAVQCSTGILLIHSQFIILTKRYGNCNTEAKLQVKFVPAGEKKIEHVSTVWYTHVVVHDPPTELLVATEVGDSEVIGVAWQESALRIMVL